jgi:hypothetical protein
MKEAKALLAGLASYDQAQADDRSSSVRSSRTLRTGRSDLLVMPASAILTPEPCL